MAADPLNNSG